MEIRSYENWDQAYSLTLSAAEETRFPKAPEQPPKGGGELGDNRGLFGFGTFAQKKPARLIGFNRDDVTSAIFGSERLREYVGVPLYEITEEAESFIRKQKKAVRWREDLLAISSRASKFLNKEGVHARIAISLFIDPEYDDWIEPKIEIRVPKTELEKAYSVYDPLISESVKGIRKKTLRRLFLTIEST